jgi:hypothetical protein
MRHQLAVDRCKLVRVFNRTTTVLTVQVDGRQWDLQPGWGPPGRDNLLPSVSLPYALRQHPRRGTFGAGHGGGESLIAIPGFTPEEQFRLIQPGREHLGPELIDREAVPHEEPVRILALPHQRNFAADYRGLADERPGDVAWQNDLPDAGLSPPPFMQPWREPTS